MRKLPLAILCSLACGAVAYAGPEPIPTSGKEMKQAVVPTPECDYTWTGFYIGGRIGYGWDAGHTHAEAVPDELTLGVADYTLDTDSDGIVGGGELGYNWQLNKWFMLGAEADFSGSGMSGDHYESPLVSAFGGTREGEIGVGHAIDWFGTVRGRIGFIPTCRLLIYGTGGFAYAHSHDFGDVGFLFGQRIPVSTFAGHDDTEGGWTAGAGLEYALSKHWSIKAEYLYIDCGDHSAFGVVFNPNLGPNTGVGERYHWENQFHTVTAGLNFKF